MTTTTTLPTLELIDLARVTGGSDAGDKHLAKLVPLQLPTTFPDPAHPLERPFLK